MKSLSLAEVLNLRFKYENLCISFDIPNNRMSGCINNIKWFKDSGHVKNRSKRGYEECLMICDRILKEYYKRE